MSGRSRDGFTIVEVMVSIGIIAVLISVFLPALAGARGAARQTQSASNVRQISLAFAMYSKDSDGLYPAVIEGRMYPIGQTMWIGFGYWQIVNTWVGVIYNHLSIDLVPDVFLSPGSRRIGYPSSYVYSTSFVGSPLLWRPGAAALPQYEHGQRTSAVVFPSGKAMLWDRELEYLPRPPERIGGDLAVGTPVASADGSVRVRVPAGASDAVVNPFPTSVDHLRLHNTADGVKGTDW